MRHAWGIRWRCIPIQTPYLRSSGAKVQFTPRGATIEESEFAWYSSSTDKHLVQFSSTLKINPETPTLIAKRLSFRERKNGWRKPCATDVIYRMVNPSTNYSQNPPLCYLVCLHSVPSPFLYMSACELHFLCATGIFRKDNHPNLNTLPRKAVWRDIIMFKRTMGWIYIHTPKKLAHGNSFCW